MTLTAVPRPHPPRGTPHHRHDFSPCPSRGPGAGSGRPDAPPGTTARVRAVPATTNRAVAA